MEIYIPDLFMIDNKEMASNNQVIVIGRQFGSGGRTVGKLVAQKLGFDYYDTELLNKAAESLGVDPEMCRRHDERKPSALRSLLQGAYGIADNFHRVPFAEEGVYQAQCKMIKQLGDKGGCVIVGRNADFILKDHPGLLSVFLHAPLGWRAKKIIERNEAITPQEAMDLAREHDRRREAYYNYYTGEKRWGVAENYDLSLDTSYMDPETVAEFIIQFAGFTRR